MGKNVNKALILVCIRNIIMVKVKIHTGRGTSIIEVDVKDLTFSGEEFQKIQDIKKKIFC